MSHPVILRLEACEDPALVGGKAAGLRRLIIHGFRVPPGICLTTALYEEALPRSGIHLQEQWRKLRTASDRERQTMLVDCRRRIERSVVSQQILDHLAASLDTLERDMPADASRLWAVRSSASNEDAARASFAGVCRTLLGVTRDEIPAAVLACWASLWTEPAFAYSRRSGVESSPQKMAVIIQPLLSPVASGVAFSQHAVTGRTDQVVINAVFGLAEALMAGQVNPDQYVVVCDERNEKRTLKVVERLIVYKPTRKVPTATGLRDETVDEEDRRKPALEEDRVLQVAALVKQVERSLGEPVDVEWAIDRRGIWLLQARAITPPGASSGPAPWSCEWSRANFKETMPELPSPMGLSFLDSFMEHQILGQYREAGCVIPEGVKAVRIVRGRPYINVTLFQSFMVQLGSDPRDVAEQMGGEGAVLPVGVERLPWWMLMRAGGRFMWKMRQAVRHAPAWFAEMKQMADDLHEGVVNSLSAADLLARMDRIGNRLRARDLTFAIVAGVGQGLQALGFLLSRAIGGEWRGLLNAALQGQGTVISAKQIHWLAELADHAKHERTAEAFFLADPWRPDQFRPALAGTRFLVEFDGFLSEFGHRALGESDVAIPRFGERPDYLLGVIRAYLQTTGAESISVIHKQQEATRDAAIREIRRRMGWRFHYWVAFRWWYRRLCRFLSLREANRHYLMYFSTATRRLALALGARLSANGRLDTRNDIFFLTADEVKAAASELSRDWKGLVARRRAEREENASQAVPDVIREGSSEGSGPEERRPPSDAGTTLQGIPISTGSAEGPVCLVLSPDDCGKVKRGDIIVAPVIDPGMAPLFGLAAGLVAEMGGTLSHGAIIAREYGLPAVANVQHATRVLKDGERVAVDAGRGTIRKRQVL